MLVRLAITGIILALLARGIDVGASLSAIGRLDRGYLALVLGLVALDRCVMIWRWVLLLRSSGVTIETRTAARIFLTSSFVGSFLPAGVGADAARAYGLSRESTSGSEALASVAVDRVLGVLSITVMAMVGLIAWPLRLLSLALFVLAIAAAAWGTGDPLMNLAPTLIWIVAWVGLSLMCACVGDVWPLLDP